MNPRVLLTAAALLPIAAPAVAQVSVLTDLGASSAYLARGLSLTSRPVVQGGVYMTLAAPAGLDVTLGAWGNLEPRAYAADAGISMTDGEAGPNLTEVDYSVEVARRLGPATASIGLLRMTFPNEGGLTPAYNTSEVTARLGAPSLPLAPRVSAYWDVDEVRGLYTETAVAHTFNVAGTLPLSLGALAGWSAGETPNASEAGELYYYQRDGLTHVDLSASAPFSLGGLSITPTLHGVLLHDQATRRVQPARTQAHTLWMAISASWTLPFGSSPE